MIDAHSYAEAAAIAESHVTQHRPGATIDEINMQAQDPVDNCEAAVRLAGEPYEVVRQSPRGKLLLLRWLDWLLGKTP